MKTLLLVIAVLSSGMAGIAQADQPDRGFVDLGYRLVRPDPRSGLDHGTGYSLDAAYLPTADTAVFGSYIHQHEPALAPASGSLDVDEYETGGKYFYEITEGLELVSALAYEQDRSTFLGDHETVGGVDLAVGLRKQATERLLLIADYEHSSVGSAANEGVVGFLYRFDRRMAFITEYSRTWSGGEHQDVYSAFLRIFY